MTLRWLWYKYDPSLFQPMYRRFAPYRLDADDNTGPVVVGNVGGNSVNSYRSSPFLLEPVGGYTMPVLCGIASTRPNLRLPSRPHSNVNAPWSVFISRPAENSRLNWPQEDIPDPRMSTVPVSVLKGLTQALKLPTILTKTSLDSVINYLTTVAQCHAHWIQ